jgi:6-phospho-beta-glucosidase
MKIAVIGGGSTYSPELINGLLERRNVLPVTELWLMDISQERLDVVGGFAQRMVAAHGSPFTVHLTTDRRAAIEGASYVVTQMRVGGMEARRSDEYLGQRYGLVGQETTGIGGMAKALRTIPEILKVARDMQETAPNALLLNFTNPAGLVSEALSRYAPSIAFAGVCNGPFGIQRHLLDVLQKRKGIASEGHNAIMQIVGLNHLSWTYGMEIDGQDVWLPTLEAYLEELEENPEHRTFDAETIRALGMVPSSYLQYFYYTAKKIASQAKWPPSRAEAVMEVEVDLLKYYADPSNNTPPADLMKRGGAYYSTVATQLINAHANNLNEIHTVNVRHDGAVAGWPADWVLEMNCRVDANGIHPLPTEPLPPVAYGLMTQVKMYELLTVEAAVHGDRKAAYQALLAHPLGPAADMIPEVLDQLLTINRPYLPQFWQNEPAQ